MAERRGRRPLDARLRWARDARQRYYQNNSAQGPRLKFYTVYDREARVFDDKYVQACRENLSDVLLFAGLLSGVSSFLAVEASGYAQRDPTTESADFLRAILYTLNSSIIPEGESILVPTIWDGPSRHARMASDLLYASFLLSILTSFLATLAGQWLEKYIRNDETSVTARCRERQRKRDGLDQWLFKPFIDGLPLLLQISLVLLGTGLVVFMTTFELTGANVVIAFTALGAGIYVLFTLSGGFSRDSPLQTPSSTVIRTVFGNILIAFPILEEKFTSAKKKLSQWVRLPKIPQLFPLSARGIDFYLGTLRTTNADDAHCVSWVLKNITGSEAIDSALQLASVVQWFEDGCNSDPPYDSIVSTFESCFDFTGSLDTKMKDRAYFSATAILQVHISALRKSEDHALKYSIPRVPIDMKKINDDSNIDAPKVDNDFKFVLDTLRSVDGEPFPSSLSLANSPERASWNSETLLWFVSNKHSDIAVRSSLIHERNVLHYPQWHKFPPKVVNNFLLVWCIHLGWEVDRRTLRIKKSDSVEKTLEKLSTLVLDAISPSDPRHQSLPYLLNGLAKWEDRPPSLAHMAFAWCAAICEEIEDDGQCASLIYPVFRVGFSCFTRDEIQFEVDYIPTVHQMVDLVFERVDYEILADALYVWTSQGNYNNCDRLLGPCAGHLVELAQADREFPPRLGQAIIRVINLVDFVERVGVERFVGLLAHLEVGIDDITTARDNWATLILEIIASEVGREQLPFRYWELLVQLSRNFSGELRSVLCDGEIIGSLEEKEEWEKLECWLGAVWIVQYRSEDEPEVEVIIQATAALLQRIPKAAQRLKGWVADSEEGSFARVHADEFQRVCGPWGDEERSRFHPDFSSTRLSGELQAPETPPSPALSLFQGVPDPPPASPLDPPQVPDLPPDPSPVQSPVPSDETSLAETQDTSGSPIQSQSLFSPPSLDFIDDED